jgi:hypothetical protein
VPVNGGEETQIVEGLNNPLSFAVANNGLYFAVGNTPVTASIDFFEFGTGKRTTLLKLGKRWFIGLAISPDQKYLVYSVIDSLSRDLMLVDKFQ